MEIFLEYAKAFLVGGALCAVGQVLIDYTKLTPARILVAYVVAGVVLGGLGWYQPLIDFAGAGASVPLTLHTAVSFSQAYIRSMSPGSKALSRVVRPSRFIRCR